MEKSTDIRHKIDFILSSDAQPTQNKVKTKYKKKQCSECNKIRTPSHENHQICQICYKAEKRIIPSGNKVIDDFIKYTQTNYAKNNGKMLFVPYEKFKNIKLIGEGGFSKIYKATWIGCKISIQDTPNHSIRKMPKIVALKKLNNSKNFTSKELNELKIFYRYSLNGKRYNIYSNVNQYYGITQDSITQDLIFIMSYCDSDLTHYIINDFFNIKWDRKIKRLRDTINGLTEIHELNIIHRDLHSRNILLKGYNAKICDLGISKSATESDDNDDKEDNIYGIIPYVAPEVLQGKKYTKASDIYSFGMIMWELMVGRRPFWDRNHNTELIIEICDGLRPPIITNAPEGYIDLMKECWHSDPEKRPTAIETLNEIQEMVDSESYPKIIESSNIGPVTTNNPDAIYKSRYLSGMIKSAASTRSLRSQSVALELDQFNFYQRNSNDKRKFEDNQFESNFINGTSNKKIKPIEDENNDYATKELELDIDMNPKQISDDEYITTEINFDI